MDHAYVFLWSNRSILPRLHSEMQKEYVDRVSLATGVWIGLV